MSEPLPAPKKDRSSNAIGEGVASIPVVASAPKIPKITISRKPFQCCIERKGKNWKSLGLVVGQDQSPHYLTVDDVFKPSLVSKWNKANKHLGTKVRNGDRITMVNGTQGRNDEMIAILANGQKGSVLKLLVEPGQ